MTAAQLHHYQAETHAAHTNRRGGVLGAIVKHTPGFEMVSALGNKVQGVMDTVKNVAHASFESAKHIAKDTLNDVKDWANEHAGAIKRKLLTVGAVAALASVVVTGPVGVIVAGTIAGGALSAGFAITKDENGHVNWKDVIKKGVIGTATGAIGGGIELGSQLLSGEPLDWKKIAKSASIGGIAGGLGAGVAGLATKVGSKVFTSIASKYSTKATAVNQQMSQVFRNVATDPATKNAVPKIVTGLKRTQQSLMGSAQRYSSFASKVGSAGAREGVAAYVEAGTDTTLTYITDGHHVTGKGLVAAWGVPAVSNAVLPKPASKGADALLRKTGWKATDGVSQKIRSEIAQGLGNFTNGVVSYSGAPMTYSPQYESFQGKDYEGPGWKAKDAGIAGLKETAKGGASSSHPVESLKSVSFEAKPVSNGVDYAGMARDSAMLSTGASGVEVSAASIYHHEKGTTNE